VVFYITGLQTPLSAKKGERLPRGKYFRGRKTGRPIFFIDEMHTLTNAYASELKEWQSGLYK